MSFFPIKITISKEKKEILKGKIIVLKKNEVRNGAFLVSKTLQKSIGKILIDFLSKRIYFSGGEIAI
ncbi:MAG: hypothetical protein IPM47_14215 [Sphingobacteriales bacterium]|nr:MAG: hypothetical protein IPM47_14215 [Sphingobacteriales bacterium]